jgi:hypothetical protein
MFKKKIIENVTHNLNILDNFSELDDSATEEDEDLD